jgi:hypothetical protein
VRLELSLEIRGVTFSTSIQTIQFGFNFKDEVENSSHLQRQQQQQQQQHQQLQQQQLRKLDAVLKKL